MSHMNPHNSLPRREGVRPVLGEAEGKGERGVMKKRLRSDFIGATTEMPKMNGKAKSNSL